MFIHGKEIAELRKNELKSYFKDKNLNLVIISCGDNPESQNYIKWKCRDAKELNIQTIHQNFPQDIDICDLKNQIRKLVSSAKNHGIILQLPLPAHLQSYKQELLDLIPMQKDVDALHSSWISRRYLDTEAIYPATPQGIINYLEYNNVNYVGKNVAILGASTLVGRPLLQYFINKRATPIILQSKSDLSVCKNFDIIIVAVGKVNLLKPKHLKQDAIVIDVGTNFIDGKLKGDCSDECKEVAKYISPVPGGVGPLTRINIFENLKYLVENHIC